jgi:inner membrane protein
VGKKAMLWGILAQSIPDIDFIATAWLSTVDDLLAHRGFTHSILFALIISTLFALIAEKLHRPHNISFARWLAFFNVLVLGHIFLDAFNNYGVGWFEPFSHYRVAFNVIYVADPFFSVVPAMAVAALLIMRKKNSRRKFWWVLGLACSGVYLCYCTVNKFYIEHQAKKIFAQEQIVYQRLLTTPAPLQNWLWFVAAATDSGYYTGYISVFDKGNKTALHFFPQQKYLADTIVFNDLRFGQIVGWHDAMAGFAFYYYLQPEANNKLVVQRGRFAKWNSASLHSFLRRIGGN